MAAIATPRLGMCHTPQQTAEVNAFDCFMCKDRDPTVKVSIILFSIDDFDTEGQ